MQQPGKPCLADSVALCHHRGHRSLDHAYRGPYPPNAPERDIHHCMALRRQSGYDIH